MHIVDPVDIAPAAIPAVDKHPARASGHLRGASASGAIEQRSGGNVRAEQLRHAMEIHVRSRAQGRVDSMGHEVSLGAAVGGIGSERIVGPIHSAGLYEIAGDQQEGMQRLNLAEK